LSFSDPLSITINSVATSFPRTVINGRSAEYATADGAYKLIISHTVDAKNNLKGESHLAKLTQRKLSTNPLVNLQEWVEASVWMVIKQPSSGYTDTELKYLIAALATSFMTAGNQDKILGNEF
jgi:hypothetical protein